MKIAICFCGHLRAAEYAADNILRFIGDLLPNCDFFIHTWEKNDNKNRSRKSQGVKDLVENLNIPIEKAIAPIVPDNTFYVLEKLKEKYNKKIEKIEIEKIRIGKNLKNVISRHYSWYRANELKKHYESLFQFKYDFVVKVRPDVLFMNDASLAVEISHYNNVARKTSKNILLWLNDVCYISSSECMDLASKSYFDLYSGNSLNFEDYCQRNNILKYKTITSDFGVYRPESIPNTSLDFYARYNEYHHWYLSSETISPYSDKT